MEKIKGFKLPQTWLSADMFGEFIEELGYDKFPILSVFKQEDKIIIKQWVDCEGDIDRFYVYQVPIYLLAGLKNRQIRLYDFMRYERIGAIIDYQNGQIINGYIVSFYFLPKSYIPDRNAFLTE